jgi:hypothetical protein
VLPAGANSVGRLKSKNNRHGCVWERSTKPSPDREKADSQKFKDGRAGIRRRRVRRSTWPDPRGRRDYPVRQRPFARRLRCCGPSIFGGCSHAAQEIAGSLSVLVWDGVGPPEERCSFSTSKFKATIKLRHHPRFEPLSISCGATGQSFLHHIDQGGNRFLFHKIKIGAVGPLIVVKMPSHCRRRQNSGWPSFEPTFLLLNFRSPRKVRMRDYESAPQIALHAWRPHSPA